MLTAFFKALGYGLCHQLPERSFASGGYQLPVCARDTGIYVGFALGVLALWLLNRGRKPTELPRWPVLVLVGAAIGAMAFDGITSYAGIRATTNDIRLITGFGTGWMLAALTVPMLNTQLWRHPGSGRVLEGAHQVGAWLLALAAAYAATRWALPATGVVYPLLTAASIVFTFGCVNLVFVGLMPPFERRALRLRDAWLQGLIALGLTGLEIALAGWLRTAVERLA